MENLEFLAVVQARFDSSRLPGKVLLYLDEKNTVLDFIYKRLSKSKKISKIIFAISDNGSDDVLEEFLKIRKYPYIRGSLKNVLERFNFTINLYKPRNVIRITGDCPFIDPNIIDLCIDKYKSLDIDYLTNSDPPTYPDGYDIEIFSRQSFKKLLLKDNLTNYDYEHVTPSFLSDKQFKIFNQKDTENYSFLRLTLDERVDYEVLKNILRNFNNIYFSYDNIINLYKSDPNIFKNNLNINRNEGAKMTEGQKLWKRAKSLIPGGNMLLSKRSEMFLPEGWPSYFSKAKGCEVWDIDGKKYLDMSIMGIGTNILGYGHPEVDDVVKDVVTKGNMSTLNCPEEVFLAERLVSMHSWSDMARFARSGGEANAISIRIARAASGKDKIAVCGYHGWHDWYLSLNLNGDDELKNHLLPGLSTEGIPKTLKNTVFPFQYNDFETLESLVNNQDIGTIKMEVSRNHGPENNFLNKIRDLCNRKNIILIFDECSSGFRETFGGLHKKYDVKPDIAMFGKALGNGYAITAILGKREIMEFAQNSFISSTFWTERIGPAAAIKTLEVMEKIKSWETITSIGEKIKTRWDSLALSNSLKIEHFGIPAFAGFSIKSDNALKYKTLITQEMLKKGILASNCIYSCIDHSNDKLDIYFNELDSIFKLINDCENEKLNIDKLLEYPICHSGFKRLN